MHPHPGALTSYWNNQTHRPRRVRTILADTELWPEVYRTAKPL